MVLLKKYVYLAISLCISTHNRDFLAGVTRLSVGTFWKDSLVTGRDLDCFASLPSGAAVTQIDAITFPVLWWLWIVGYM